MPKNETDPVAEKTVGPLAEQESLLSSGLRRMQTVSDAVKTKANMATKDKIHGIVSSRKTISGTASGATQSNKKAAVKQISGKKAPYK
jgi:hypothetical protein